MPLFIVALVQFHSAINIYFVIKRAMKIISILPLTRYPKTTRNNSSLRWLFWNSFLLHFSSKRYVENSRKFRSNRDRILDAIGGSQCCCTRVGPLPGFLQGSGISKCAGTVINASSAVLSALQFVGFTRVVLTHSIGSL